MKFVQNIIKEFIYKEPQILLGRWRFVGVQKNNTDLIQLKIKNKMSRYNLRNTQKDLNKNHLEV